MSRMLRVASLAQHVASKLCISDFSKLHGAFAAVFTPFHENGSVNVNPIPQYAQYLSKNGIQHVLVGGTTGEFVSMTVEEKKLVLDAWLKEAKSLNLKIMVHVGGAPLPYVIEMAKYAELVKADAIMSLPELYFKPKTPEQVVSYLEEVAKAAPSLPLVYYNNPLMSGVDVGNYSTFFRLAVERIPNFMGIKADFIVANQIANQLTGGRKIYITNHVLAPSVLMGHDCSIATLTTIVPRLVLDTVKSAKAGDVDKARSLQTKLNQLVDTISVAGNIVPGGFVPSMKVAMELISGIKLGPPRLPQYPLDSQRVTKIHENLKELGYVAH